jgi:N6-adenosine-specific RNA methylase IME4
LGGLDFDWIRWGYTYVDEIVWVKMTTNRRLAKSHGYYLQHAKEVCLVGKKGDDPAGLCSNVLSDIIMRCACRKKVMCHLRPMSVHLSLVAVLGMHTGLLLEAFDRDSVSLSNESHQR